MFEAIETESLVDVIGGACNGGCCGGTCPSPDQFGSEIQGVQVKKTPPRLGPLNPLFRPRGSSGGGVG
jgi:hypothetical protein